MNTQTTIQAMREEKIQRMMEITKCSQHEAVVYLIAEEWVLSDALESYRVDKAGSL